MELTAPRNETALKFRTEGGKPNYRPAELNQIQLNRLFTSKNRYT